MSQKVKSDVEQDNEKEDKPKKCLTCYFEICMLTPFMAEHCGGPFKDKQHHLDYIENEVVDKEKK